MPDTTQSPNAPFIEVDYAAKIVFTPRHESQERPDVRATWQQSQELWKDHPVFHDLVIDEMMTWLRGEDSDI